jgi:hypothetical protein
MLHEPLLSFPLYLELIDSLVSALSSAVLVIDDILMVTSSVLLRINVSLTIVELL